MLATKSPLPWPRKGWRFEFVVNNAGFGLFGSAIELDRAEQFGIIAVNIRAMTDLSLRFSDSLVRHRGGILNVGSLAGFLPGPGMAVYHASKTYVLSFSEALHQELAPCGVRVTTLCPGSVSTDFQARAGIKPGLEHKILNLSASDVAQAGYLRADPISVFAAIFSARVYPGSGRSRSTATAQIRFHNADVHVPMLTRSRSGPDHLKFAKSKAATLHLRIVLLLPDHLPSAPDFVPQYRSYLLDAFRRFKCAQSWLQQPRYSTVAGRWTRSL